MTWLEYLKFVTTDIGSMSVEEFKRHINWCTATWIPVDNDWKLQVRDSFFGVKS